MQPPAEAQPVPKTESQTLMVVLEKAEDMEKAEAILEKVEGVQKVDCSDKGCTVTAQPGKAKAVADALKAAGIQASVWVKVA